MAYNWDVTWVGFDVLLLAMMVATAVLGYLRRQLLVVTAFATGILLICDAWFDVMTAHGDDRTWSVVTALAVELPFAAVLIAGSLQVLRLSAPGCGRSTPARTPGRSGSRCRARRTPRCGGGPRQMDAPRVAHGTSIVAPQ